MRRILCATDLSEASDEAIRQADELARNSGAALALCHVVPDIQRVHALFPQLHFAEAMAAPELERRAQEALFDRAQSVANRGPDDVEIFVELGTGYAEILARAETWKADLVVTGSRGRGAFARAMLGSVAGQVVRYAHCPVLVARPHAARGVVIAATDLSDAALPAVHAAADEAKRRGAKLVIVHVLELPVPSALWALGSPFGITNVGPSEETMREVHGAARVTLDSALARFGATGEVVIADGDPAAAVLREAESRDAELVVVGTRGRTGIARVALGSVAEKIVQMAASSVLAVRFGDELPT
jgi:nucleotide-binding universal stress UspA family protein